MTTRLLSSLCFLLLLFGSVQVVTAQIPRTISYQAIVNNPGGGPISDGVHLVTFTIYAVATGGTPLYTETQNIEVQSGLLNAVIGTTVNFPAGLRFDRPYWLAISLDGGATILPRTEFTSSPYALSAFRADSALAIADGATGIVRTINGESGGLTFVGGGSTTVTKNGKTLTISSTAGGGGTITQVANTDSALTILGGNGPLVTVNVRDGGIRGSMLADGSISAAKLDTTGAGAGQALIFDGTSVVFSEIKFSLPFVDTVDASDAFSITNSGDGRVGHFELSNGTSNAVAVVVETDGTGEALLARRTKTSGTSPTIRAETMSASNGSGITVGATALYGEATATTGGGWSAGVRGVNRSTSGNGIGVIGYQAGSGWGLLGETVSGTGVRAVSGVGGNALVAIYSGTTASTTTANNIAIFQAPSPNGGAARNQARIDAAGKGFFNGGTVSSGADVAELFDVEDLPSLYEPGDVMAISLESDRTITLSTEPYSQLVVGVYATKPGVLLTEEHIDADHSSMVPLGVIGVIPTKVCNENGPIGRGDLLVSSSRPGYAMKGDPEVAKERPGAILGKALETFEQGETGLIRVLVNVR